MIRRLLTKQKIVMNTHKIETILTENGKLLLDNIPYSRKSQKQQPLRFELSLRPVSYLKQD